MDNVIDQSRWGAQAKKGETEARYALFYHPLFMPNNTWVWRFIPGVVFGFVGSLLLLGSRSRRKPKNQVRMDAMMVPSWRNDRADEKADTRHTRQWHLLV